MARLKTWDEWYAFARDQLALGEQEAGSYATLRSVEEENHLRLSALQEAAAGAGRGDDWTADDLVP